MKKRLVYLTAHLVLLSSILLVSATQALAYPSFEASYRVTSNQYSLAPSATIQHQLTYDQGEVTSHMNASVRLARWEETSTFYAENGQLEAGNFDMYTRVILRRRNYELATEDFDQELPAYDRQSAIFYMATAIHDMEPDQIQSIMLVDERGLADELVIDLAGFTEMEGLKVAEVYFWKTKKPAEYTQAYLAIDYPGLLVFAQVHGSKGEKLLTFQLLDWERL
ncbi:hypothetical protein SAMN05660443_1363 [Marinospirillum celere]|uniref:DUF3108 domain-containing protein n=1 Tax=Marinospirillum celere TaxID=1122252 RepID=A0A1I1G1R8_9GAMM|nr:hypothetical protein [Marinospirillum celere]SFC05779.1 hypothetical protein SAMN05660443_1363 [Marinospirillum celere]